MKRILSLQSAVVAGFVGNTVAGPVLIATGHHPLLVNTVSLAAHPGYGGWAGGVTTPVVFADILDGVRSLYGLAQIDQIMTGYLGSPEQVQLIASFIAEWQAQANGIYILDPVIGDAGRPYVAPEITASMIEMLMPLADIITPNQFELSQLAGRPVSNWDDAAAAASLLFEGSRLDAVIATGVTTADERRTGDMLMTRNGEITWQDADMIAGDVSGAGNVAGGGDLLTAIISGRIASGQPLKQAFEMASRQTQTILRDSPSSRDIALLENLPLLRQDG